MLTSLVAPAASQEEAASGKPPPVVVLAGDFNSEQAQVENAIEGLVVPNLRHERLCFVGLQKEALKKLSAKKRRDWM